MKIYQNSPDDHVDASAAFGLEMRWAIPAFTSADEHVPEIDERFTFSEDVTRAILMGFAHNRRVYLHGPHGSGKTTHIEQVAARLNWPCVRINLDGHITRADLIGRDMIVLKDGNQVTEFVPGLLIWALERPVALVFDEFDAGRPDVMFVIQRLLESEGGITLLDQNRVIKPHPAFRLFATANTAGQGDPSGLYVGTQIVNQAQMDRWHVIAELEYLGKTEEKEIIHRRFPALAERDLSGMIEFASLCRNAYRQGDLSILFSLRTLITWCENYQLLGSVRSSLRFAFYNRCEQGERPFVSELFQRCFAKELMYVA